MIPKCHCALLVALVLASATPIVGEQAANPANSQQSPLQPSPPPPKFAPTPGQFAMEAAWEEDHRRLMKELGINRLRPPVHNDLSSPNPVNYDETKANVYANIPDPLIFRSGQPVTSPQMWWDKRRPELSASGFPAIGGPFLDGDLAFRQHSGGHTPAPNWPYFLAFAARYLQVPSRTGPGRASTPAQDQLLSAPLTAEQDRLRLLAMLGLKESDLRPAPVTDARSARSANYDEAKANQFPQLPDPLVLSNGRPVRNKSDWSVRRRELREDFDREILGRTPRSMPDVAWHIIGTTHEKYGGVEVVTKRIQGRVDPWMGTNLKTDIDLLLTVPEHSAGPVPVVLELAFARDFALATGGPLDSYVPTPWGVDGKLAVERGWGFAILNPVSYQKDDGSGLTEGIIGITNQGRPRKLEDWGVLKAWAWGVDKVLHYLETDRAVDAKQVALAGHSRFGKAVLVTMAYYPEFAVGYVSSSGEGGAKLYRHIYGETIPNLASASLYHWFDGNFLRYAGPLNAGDLPVDNHELIALCAPHPLFIGGGSDQGDGYADPHGDAWADPRGMFLAEVAAGPVYRLLGAKGLSTSEFPKAGTALTEGDLAFRQHHQGHTPQPNWPYFLEFASRYLHGPQARQANEAAGLRHRN